MSKLKISAYGFRDDGHMVIEHSQSRPLSRQKDLRKVDLIITGIETVSDIERARIALDSVESTLKE
jgi:hypothetical protein